MLPRLTCTAAWSIRNTVARLMSNIGQRVQQREIRPTNSFSFVSARLLASNSSTAPPAAERADHAHAGQVLARVRPVTRSSPVCAFLNSGMLTSMMKNVTASSTGIDTAKTTAQWALIVNAMTIAPKNDERAAQQQAQAHVEAVLHLVHVVGQPRDQRVAADRVQLRERERLDVVEHRLPQQAAKPTLAFAAKNCAVKLHPMPTAAISSRIKKADDDVRAVVVRDADVDHLRDDDRHEQIEHDLEELEKRCEHLSAYCTVSDKRQDFS